MARMLVMAERVISQPVRTDYLASMAARREKARVAGANFWAFEQVDGAGTFLEFIEAGSLDELVAAAAEVNATGADFPQKAPVWREVGGV